MMMLTAVSLLGFFITPTLGDEDTTTTASANNNNWIDADTPQSAYTTQTKVSELVDTAPLFDLVMSDEFNTPGRTFNDGYDPMWTAMNKNDYTNNALHYYDHRNIVTNSDGELEITTTAEDTEVIGFDEVKQEKVHLTKHFKSGMLQSWNKFCFTGGIIEAEVVLPGKWNVGGLWPAFWILGNLSRHTYLGSSSNVWPWSLLECTNEEMINSQALSACLGATHWGMEKGVGRGAPEVDIFEVQPGPVKGNTGMFKKTWIGEPFMSASYQVAPGKSWDRPGPGFWPGPDQWYRGIQTGPNTTINIMFYGNWNSFGTKSRKHTSRRRLKANSQSPSHNYWSDALSYNHQLNSDHFETRHKYRLEWGLPSDDKDATGLDSGYLNWYLDDEFVLSIRADNIKTFTNATVPTEPSSIIFNTAISTDWSFPKPCPKGCPCDVYDCKSSWEEETCGFPINFCQMLKDDAPKYKVNYVRVYQNKQDERQKVGCSTPERPTRDYIEANLLDKFVVDGEKQALKPIQRGGGACDGESSTSCGGETKGICNVAKRTCDCQPGYTGPTCLAQEGSDPYDWDPPGTISDIGYYGPSLTVSPFVYIAIGTVLFMFGAVASRRKMDGWIPIPDH